MATSDESKTEESKDKNTQPEQTPKTIFSYEEIESTVKGFLQAYLRGLIRVDFTSADEIAFIEAKKGVKVDYKTAFNIEGGVKKHFEDLVAVCVGINQATPLQLRESVNGLFRVIIVLRSSHRIEGTFLETKIEQKLDDLEIKLNATNKVIEELVKWLIEEAKADE